MDYSYLQDWTDKLFGEPLPLPFNSRRRVKAEAQSDPKELNESNIDDSETLHVKGIRCELCDKLLKYGTRASYHTKDSIEGYVCSSCRADHEVWVLPPGGSGDHVFERLPKKTICDSVIVYYPNSTKVKDVLLGCGAESGPWEQRANGYVRMTIHKSGCKVREADNAS